MGISLCVGMLITPIAEAFFTFLKSHVISVSVVVGLVLAASLLIPRKKNF